MAANGILMPAFKFSVDWAGTNIGFSEVTGLVVETQVIEYRSGDSPDSSTDKMPGMQKYGNITLKRGVAKGDNEFFAWWNTVALNTIERRDITIKLLDEAGAPVVVWTVKQAFPVKVDGGTLKSTENGALIESIELAHKGIVTQNN